ncbi:hypothetical protein BSL78_10412 [Apostichopus japonicus]|uniref:Ig-like domain-containing protein n=1 Tax=Stichopus japonicus TaxID=307972 RepID=A0A2G8KXI2_STIJA|nr:hypothetical protein BSL78_10412 [Apostichopus japonicus]
MPSKVHDLKTFFLILSHTAIPISVSISCARSSSTDCSSPSSPTSNPFNCNCVAIGAYPNNLQFEWSGGATGVQQSYSNSTERTGTVDFYTDAEIVPTENPGSVTCTLNGYNQTREGVRNATYMFHPQICELDIICIKTGTMVSLTCTCTEASPAEGLVYSFFRDGELLSIGDTNVFEAAVEVDQEYIFGCRGCNGVNYGSVSYVTQTVICQEIAMHETGRQNTYHVFGMTYQDLHPGYPLICESLKVKQNWLIWFFQRKDSDIKNLDSDIKNSDSDTKDLYYSGFEKVHDSDSGMTMRENVFT